jgi:ribosomal protein S18 acetylase RimI-like enzyme
LPIAIQRVAASELDEYCRVARDVFGDAPSPEILRQQDERAEASGALRDRYIAHGHGQTVAIGALASSPLIPAEAVDLRIGVQRAHRGGGIGAAMLARLETEAAQRGYRQLIASVRADDPQSLEFAFRRGFEHQHDRHELELDLRASESEVPTGPGNVSVASLDQSPAGSDRTEVANTLAELIALSPDTRDLPKWDQASITSFLFENPSTRPEWIFLARDGHALVGMAVMTQIADRAYAFFTGVHPSAQRRGIARALKRASILAAKRDGFHRMFADNLSTNTAMLALNRSLGFQHRRAARILQKTIGR